MSVRASWQTSTRASNLKMGQNDYWTILLHVSDLFEHLKNWRAFFACAVRTESINSFFPFNCVVDTILSNLKSLLAIIDLTLAHSCSLNLKIDARKRAQKVHNLNPLYLFRMANYPQFFVHVLVRYELEIRFHDSHLLLK